MVTRRSMLVLTRCAAAGMVALQVCGAAAAHAQGTPYRPVFGGAGNRAEASQMFELALSIAEAYDSNVLAEDGAGAGPALQLGGLFTALSAEVRYAKRARRAQFAANLGTNLRYFQQFGEVSATGHDLGIGLSMPLGQKTTFAINEALSYTPSYLFGLFAKAQPASIGDVVPAAPNYLLSDRRSYTSVTDARLSRRVGRRSTVDLAAGYRRSEFFGPGATALSNLTSYEAGGHFGYGINRDLTLRLGYLYRQAEYGAGHAPTTHDIAIGADYNRPLSRSRRTRLGLSFGSSIFDAPPPGQTVGPSVRQLHARANVLLTHRAGRTWTARAAYTRGAQFVEELSAPVLSDSVTISTDGFITRKTDLTVSAAYATGNLVGRPDSAFETYTANARFRLGLTRTVAAFAEYVYYFYDFQRGVQLIDNVPLQIGRNGIRVGLTFWVPFIGK